MLLLNLLILPILGIFIISAYTSYSIPNVVPINKDIFKELNIDIGMKIPNHGNLNKWLGQGIVLLNRVLTVEDSKPNSHRGIGWEKFTASTFGGKRLVVVDPRTFTPTE